MVSVFLVSIVFILLFSSAGMPLSAGAGDSALLEVEIPSFLSRIFLLCFKLLSRLQRSKYSKWQPETGSWYFSVLSPKQMPLKLLKSMLSISDSLSPSSLFLCRFSLFFFYEFPSRGLPSPVCSSDRPLYSRLCKCFCNCFDVILLFTVTIN